MSKVDELSPKERALWDKVNSAPKKRLTLDQLTQQELGILGKLKQRDLVEIKKDYINHVKYVEVKVKTE